MTRGDDHEARRRSTTTTTDDIGPAPTAPGRRASVAAVAWFRRSTWGRANREHHQPATEASRTPASGAPVRDPRDAADADGATGADRVGDGDERAAGRAWRPRRRRRRSSTIADAAVRAAALGALWSAGRRSSTGPSRRRGSATRTGRVRRRADGRGRAGTGTRSSRTPCPRHRPSSGTDDHSDPDRRWSRPRPGPSARPGSDAVGRRRSGP